MKSGSDLRTEEWGRYRVYYLEWETTNKIHRIGFFNKPLANCNLEIHLSLIWFFIWITSRFAWIWISTSNIHYFRFLWFAYGWRPKCI
jgi:hypothetical protein